MKELKESRKPASEWLPRKSGYFTRRHLTDWLRWARVAGE
jgi:hypothetical protein